MGSLQVRSNGWLNAGIASAGAGWQVDGTGGMTVDTTGITILAGGIASSGDLQVKQGSLSVASSYTESALDVYANVALFTGNAILGRVPFGSPSNAMLLAQNTDVLFKVTGITDFHRNVCPTLLCVSCLGTLWCRCNQTVWQVYFKTVSLFQQQV
jgi:hypothetical protein